MKLELVKMVRSEGGRACVMMHEGRTSVDGQFRRRSCMCHESVCVWVSESTTQAT